MDAARTTQQIDSPRSFRAQRGAAAVVAQYIHELSDRHAVTRRGNSGARKASLDSARIRPRLRIPAGLPCGSES